LLLCVHGSDPIDFGDLVTFQREILSQPYDLSQVTPVFDPAWFCHVRRGKILRARPSISSPFGYHLPIQNKIVPPTQPSPPAPLPRGEGREVFNS
jgi:hypothetical protein